MSEASKIELKCPICNDVIVDRGMTGDMSYAFSSEGTGPEYPYVHYECAVEALEDILFFVEEEYRLVLLKAASAARAAASVNKTRSLVSVLTSVNHSGNPGPWVEALAHLTCGLHAFEGR
jgi:hypothetical protein